MKFILSLLIFAIPATAVAQSKFFATSSRGGAEGAKQNAMLQTLIQENAARMAETAANAASITTLRDATEASLTTVSDCGAQGTLFGPGHALADGNDCIPSLQVANDGNVLFQGGAKFGTSALCDPTAEGTIRYNVSAKRMEFCNGEVWGMMGGSAGCSINFPAVANADLDTFYDTTDAIYSGTTATASVAGATAATIRRNGGNTGMSSGVTINQGNSVGIRGRSASLFNQTAAFTLDIGSYTACWQITTKQQDVMPNSFSFTDLTNQELSTLVTSNSVTVNGFDGPLAVSVSGQGSPELKVGSGAWDTSGAINPGDTLRIRMTTSPSFSTSYAAGVNLGALSTAWETTTKPECAIVNGAHTCNQCTALGGTLYQVAGPSNSICRFSASSCPSGWSRHQNWSTTLTYHYPLPVCSGSTTCAGHAWSNQAQEICPQFIRDNYAAGINSSCGCQCEADGGGPLTISEIGCY